MTKLHGLAASLILHFASPLSGLRRVPVVGDFLSWTSRCLLPPRLLVWVQIQHGPAQGLWIRVNPRTGQAVRQGIDEPAVQLAFQRHLRLGMTFYDLGANIGFFSLLAARLVGPSGHVISFEADPEIAVRLRENLARNKFSHVTVEQKAVWSETSMVSFVRVETNISPDRGLGYVSTGNLPTGAGTSVEAVSLDEFVSLHPAPDFLKCDVEGAEVAVFQGAQRVLRENRPILLVEMHSAENHRALTQEFAQVGYACRNLDENHVLAVPQ